MVLKGVMYFRAYYVLGRLRTRSTLGKAAVGIPCDIALGISSFKYKKSREPPHSRTKNIASFDMLARFHMLQMLNYLDRAGHIVTACQEMELRCSC